MINKDSTVFCCCQTLGVSSCVFSKGKMKNLKTTMPNEFTMWHLRYSYNKKRITNNCLKIWCYHTGKMFDLFLFKRMEIKTNDTNNRDIEFPFISIQSCNKIGFF